MDTETGKIRFLKEGEKPHPKEKIMQVSPTEKQLQNMKVGRNDPCPCGSGIKFKKCCKT